MSMQCMYNHVYKLVYKVKISPFQFIHISIAYNFFFSPYMLNFSYWLCKYWFGCYSNFVLHFWNHLDVLLHFFPTFDLNSSLSHNRMRWRKKRRTIVVTIFHVWLSSENQNKLWLVRLHTALIASLQTMLTHIMWLTCRMRNDSGSQRPTQSTD